MPHETDSKTPDPNQFATLALLFPLALLIASLFLPFSPRYRGSGGLLGWEVLQGSLTSLGSATQLYLLSLGLLAVSSGRGWTGRVGRVVAWLLALGTLPSLLLFYWFRDCPGFWLWTVGLWAQALVPYMARRGPPLKWPRPRESVAGEVAISAAMSAPLAAALTVILFMAGVRPPQGAALLVPATLALAGSASLGAFLAVLAWRLERRRRLAPVVKVRTRSSPEAGRVAARWRRGVVRRRGA
jgi:hypothetical protein